MKKNSEENTGSRELQKLKKQELLEIMLRQGEEIDELRARIAELEKVVAAKDEVAKIFAEDLRRRYG